MSRKFIWKCDTRSMWSVPVWMVVPFHILLFAQLYKTNATERYSFLLIFCSYSLILLFNFVLLFFFSFKTIVCMFLFLFMVNASASASASRYLHSNTSWHLATQNSFTQSYNHIWDRKIAHRQNQTKANRTFYKKYENRLTENTFSIQ